ncbi:MAG: hypothetical protein DRI90_24285 [Deltaproteobacteria bacterium]|nr:MAG: hypothetical protein DRI90_24285 [Deltaproteobacteria bacterium]
MLSALLLPGSALAQSEAAKQQARAHMQQAAAYLKAKAYDKVVEEYQAAYKLVPKPGFLFNIGLTYEQAGEKQKALDQYRRYLKLAPNGKANAEAKARVTALERELAAEAESAAETERAKAETEKHRLVAEGHVATAKGHIEAKQWAKAREELTAAFAEHPEPNYVYQLAEVYRLEENLPKAVVEYERYRELAPTGPHGAEALEKIASLKRELAPAPLIPEPSPTAKPLEPAPKPPPPARQEPSDPPGTWRKGFGVFMMAFGGHAALNAVMFLILAGEFQSGAEEDRCLERNDRTLCSSDGREELELARANANVGQWLGIGGLTLFATGAVLIGTAPSREPAEGASSVQITPLFSAEGGAQLQLQGSF